MSKPRKLSRPEIEGLADFFGCRVSSTPYKDKDKYEDWNFYITCSKNRNREFVGSHTTNNPAYLSWTNHDWTKAFQRISGISGANLWDQGKRGRR